MVLNEKIMEKMVQNLGPLYQRYLLLAFHVLKVVIGALGNRLLENPSANSPGHPCEAADCHCCLLTPDFIFGRFSFTNVGL